MSDQTAHASFKSFTVCLIGGVSRWRTLTRQDLAPSADSLAKDFPKTRQTFIVLLLSCYHQSMSSVCLLHYLSLATYNTFTKKGKEKPQSNSLSLKFFILMVVMLRFDISSQDFLLFSRVFGFILQKYLGGCREQSLIKQY